MEVGVPSVYVVGKRGGGGGPKCSWSKERGWRWGSQVFM